MTTKTLRDEFAMAALTGLLGCAVLNKEIKEHSNAIGITQKEEAHVHSAVFSTISYSIADAMLREREKGGRG